MANVIYGINANAGFTDVIDTDEALKTLGLDPEDLNTVNDISAYINIEEFHALSQVSGSPNATLVTTAIEKIGQHIDTQTQLAQRLENRATVARPTTTGVETETIPGNIVLNGPLAATAIRYFSTELMNAATGAFEPLDISTSRVSAWSRSGSRITYGGDLRISSVSPRKAFDVGQHDAEHATPKLGIGKIIIDGRIQKTQIAPRIFAAEQATHKLKVNINGNDVYLYAMKNIPLVFEGNFRGRGGSTNIFETSSTTGGADFRVITGNNSENFFTNATGGDLAYPGRGKTTRTIELYQAPAKLTEIKTHTDGLGITNFPTAEYTNLATLEFPRNLLKVIPNFAKITPGGTLTKLNLFKNPLFESPLGSNRSLNRLSFETISRIPTSVTDLNIAECYGPRFDNSDGRRVYSGDVKRQLPNLTKFQLGSSQNVQINSPFYPEVPKGCKQLFFNELEGPQLPGTSQVKVIPLGDSYSRLDSDLSVKHNASLDVVDTGTVTKATKLKIRRSLDMFSVEVDCPGAGYTAGSFVVTKPGTGTGGNALANAVAGGFSPQGIPFGTVTITVDGDGGITGGTFLPHNTKSEFAASTVSVPSSDANLTGSATRDVGVHIKDSGYSPMGFYIDCGMFSSPISIAQLHVSDCHSRMFHKHDAYLNPFAKVASVTALGNTATYASGDKVNGPNHNVYNSFSRINATHSDFLGIPDLRDVTTLTNWDMDSAFFPAFDGIVRRATRLRDTLGVLPGLDCPNYSPKPGSITDASGAKAHYAFLWGRSRTLYDSPKDSPFQPAGEGGQSSKRGKNGFYKFSGCSSLKTIDLTNSRVGGTVPSFTGNTSLETINLGNTFFNRGELGEFDSPLLFKLNAFEDCRDTLKRFVLQVTKPQGQFNDANKILSGDMWGWYASPSGDIGRYAPASRTPHNDTSSTSDVRIDPFPKCTLKYADSSTADSGKTPALEIGDGPFDRLGTSLDVFVLRTRIHKGDSKGNRGLFGPVPTFKNATNLRYLNLASNSFGRHAGGAGEDSLDGQVLSSLGTDVMDFSYQYTKIQYINLGNNNITGDLSFQQLANGSNTGGGNGFPRLREFHMWWNYLSGITDWGADGVVYGNLWRLHFSNGFIPVGESYSRSSSQMITIPSMKDKFPKLKYLYLQGSYQPGRGGIAAFADDLDFFRGMKRINTITLQNNRLSKVEIVKILKALRQLCRDENVRGVTINFKDQREYDGLDGKTDFRMGIASDIAPFRQKGQGNTSTNYGYNSDWAITDGWPEGQQNTIEVNDLIEELTNESVYNCTLTGIEHSTIPQAPDAPTTFEFQMTGDNGNQLQATRLTDPTGYVNLFNYTANTISGTLSIQGIDQDTESLQVRLLNYRGIELPDYELNITRNQMESGAGNTLTFSRAFEIALNGQSEPINKFDTTAPYDLNTTLDAGVTDYSQNKQTLTFVCTPTGFRGTGQSAFATYDFINQIRYVATSDGDYEGESREWRLLEE